MAEKETHSRNLSIFRKYYHFLFKFINFQYRANYKTKAECKELLKIKSNGFTDVFMPMIYGITPALIFICIYWCIKRPYSMRGNKSDEYKVAEKIKETDVMQKKIDEENH